MLIFNVSRYWIHTVLYELLPGVGEKTAKKGICGSGFGTVQACISCFDIFRNNYFIHDIPFKKGIHVKFVICSLTINTIGYRGKLITLWTLSSFVEETTAQSSTICNRIFCPFRAFKDCFVLRWLTLFDTGCEKRSIFRDHMPQQIKKWWLMPAFTQNMLEKLWLKFSWEFKFKKTLAT